MILKDTVGILGYGVSIPIGRISLREISIANGLLNNRFEESARKSAPSRDEDQVTLGVEAALNALRRSGIPAPDLKAVFVGSESKPYAVKPAAVTVASAIGAGSQIAAADLEFACKAGTEALRTAFLHATTMENAYALAIGADCAQGRPGDELEYSAGAGAAAFIVGPKAQSLALLEATTAFATDTPDFFRRSEERFPVHGHRFTGQPAYFAHTLQCARQILEEANLRPEDFAHVVFHQPNKRFPSEAATTLGFSNAQLDAGMLVESIGNTYAASSLLGLAAVLDVAQPEQRILCVSYGSGAGADGFIFRVTDKILERSSGVVSVQDFIKRVKNLDYTTYLRLTGSIQTT